MVPCTVLSCCGWVYFGLLNCGCIFVHKETTLIEGLCSGLLLIPVNDSSHKGGAGVDRTQPYFLTVIEVAQYYLFVPT